jgi:hypothetical protein
VLLKNLVIPAQRRMPCRLRLFFVPCFIVVCSLGAPMSAFANSGPAAKKFWAAICQKPEIVALSEARGLA